MTRLPGKALDKIKKKYDVDKILSYSRISTFMERKWEYRMIYLEKKERPESVYSYLGGKLHDVIQDHIDGKYSYGEMADRYEEVIEEWEMKILEGSKHLEFKGDKSEATERNYVRSLRHYFNNTSIPDYDIRNETPILLVVKDKERDKNIVLIGYVDSEYWDEDGYLHLVDYKTSSKGEFTPKKLSDKSKQLKLYAMGISQYRGVPLDKIRMRFDMMKYVEVFYHQKNGKWRGFAKDRHKWVEQMGKKIYKALTDEGIGGLDDFKAQDLLDESIENNSIDNLPKSVQELFRVENYYIHIEITEEDKQELEQMLIDVSREMEDKVKGDWDEEFPEPIIDPNAHGGDTFYYTVLAPQLLKYHKGWKEAQEMNQAKEDNAEEMLDSFY